jgi:methyltransferase family protein
MNIITDESLADIEFRLKWKSDEADHEERLYSTVNIYRDILPPGFADRLTGKGKADRIETRYDKTENLLASVPSNKVTVKRSQFNSETIAPRYGRFYPLGLIKDLPNVFSGNMKPFRLTGVDDRHIQVDLNHPLANYDLLVSAQVHNSILKPYDRGGECSVLMECLCDGPGMQVRGNGRPTEFFSEDSFKREDETDDTLFYQQPRFVNHIDDKARETISEIYGSLMLPGMDVLDLMSAWRSHVPDNSKLKSLVGLGMNAQEMADNPQLTDYTVHDLNDNPKLPFADNSFDLVICTVSVEYLIHPEDVFASVANVLRPGGAFVLTFSNRWFPPKAIRLWPGLHEFERMGLVLEYFNRSGRFGDFHTFSSRGWPRPEGDKYYREFLTSDPVYAVWGRSLV